jgi:hypothetical protein
MSHLSRRYTEHYYVEGAKGKLEKKDVLHLNSPKYIAMQQAQGIAAQPYEMPNAVFPCQHEERGFVSVKGKKNNRTHARWKRRNKARIRARKTK